MSVIQSPNRRKRQSSSDWDRASTQDQKGNDRKRQKRCDSTSVQCCSNFWDNLSKIHLTSAAVQELQRRSSANQRHSPKPRRPYTRSRARLESNLTLFAENGGPDMADVRGCPPPADRPQRPTKSRQSISHAPRQNPTPLPSDQASTETASTKSSGPYNRNFQQHLVDHGVFPPNYKYPNSRTPPLPRNWSEINKILGEPRRSLSPSRVSADDFRKFQQADADAFKEKQVSELVIPIIDGQSGNGQCRSGGVAFRNLDPLTDGTIKPGNPDIYEGARPEQLNPRIRNELRGKIMPTTQEDQPICPNFFVAVKGVDGSLAVAMRQTCYDGALGARATHSLLTYGSVQSVPDNSAHTITSIYHGGQLKMYTTSRVEPVEPHKNPEYHTHQLNTWGMTGNIEVFRQGLTAFRNARDWAEQQRNEAIANANSTVHEDTGPDLVDASLSPDSTRYTTPPTELTSGTSLPAESPVTRLETSKRDRTEIQGSSPIQQQKKRGRVNDRRQQSPLGSGTGPASASTSISFQFAQHDLARDRDGSSEGTEKLSSDEGESIRDTVET